MKRISTRFAILLFLFLPAEQLYSQVATSGKVTVRINNKPPQEQPVLKQEVPPSQQEPTDIKQETPIQENIKKDLQIQTIEPPESVTNRPGLNLLAGGGKYYALVIGVNDYADPSITNLDRPIKDAEAFYNTITSKYTFDSENVKILLNPTYAEIVESLDYYTGVVQKNDNFLIFYAGHGFWDKSAEVGYWFPADTRRNSKLAWFRNSTLRDYLKEIKSKHTLLISDACFSGAIFKTRSVFIDATPAINKLYELPSRKAMTSGTLTEVPDQSVFLKYLIDRLQGNTERYLSSEQLFSSFRVAVINNSNVVPQFGEIRDVGDEGGDFIFILR